MDLFLGKQDEFVLHFCTFLDWVYDKTLHDVTRHFDLI